MTDPDYRALCAEIVTTWDKDYPWDHVDDPDCMGALLDRARAALARPAPEPPTDEELYERGPHRPLCHAHKDGECFWELCPQIRDGEPNKSGRHCPLDLWHEEDE